MHFEHYYKKKLQKVKMLLKRQGEFFFLVSVLPKSLHFGSDFKSALQTRSRVAPTQSADWEQDRGGRGGAPLQHWSSLLIKSNGPHHFQNRPQNIEINPVPK